MRRHLPAVGAALSLLLGAVVAVAVPSNPASAETLAEARRHASQLRVQVDELRAQAEIAIEDYNASYERLGQAVTAHLSAQRAVADAEVVSGATSATAAQRVRALYMSGGRTALLATVLDSASITEAATRVHQVSLVLGHDRRSTLAAEGVVADRRALASRLKQTAAVSTELQKVVAAKADKVELLLAQTDALLSSANSRVLQLVEQQRLAAQAAAAARAAAALALARAQLGNLADLPATPTARAALDFAAAQIGKPYVWGATGPDSYDCSGLTGAAYRAAGVQLPRTSRQQWYAGTHVELGALMPGDLLFWANDVSNPATIHHVALYAGKGMMIAAPQTGDVVKMQPVYLDGYIGAVRPAI
jgi:cell wall-associated NlpC family hydrolase